MAINKDWKWAHTHDGRRADLSGAFRDATLTLMQAAEPISKLEHVESELEKSRLIGVFEETKKKLDEIVLNIY